MPMWDIECTECGKVSEVVSLSMTEEIECPSCKCRRVNKLPCVFAHRWNAAPSETGTKAHRQYERTRKEKKQDRVDTITKKQLKEWT